MQKDLILLLEDEPIISADVVAVCEQAGWSVIHFEREERLLAWLKQHRRAKLVLSNFRLGAHANGVILASHIYEDYQIPTLFITGARMSEVEASNKKHGSSFDCLLKPFTSMQLRHFVQHVMKE